MKITVERLSFTVVLGLFILLMNSCSNAEESFSKPVLTTSEISLITETSAVCGGLITEDGGAPVTARGVCWSTTSNPTISNSSTKDSSGLGSFTSSISGLTPNTTYFVRSYAKNSVGTSYGNEVNFTTKFVTDMDGNVYTTVVIGTQEWMVENLKTTKYNDGTSIPNVTNSTSWSTLSTPGYCSYNNTTSNLSTYGALYNWYAVNTGKLAPIGWHVATDAEWTTLETYLANNGYGYGGSGSDVAKALASKTGWTIDFTPGNIGDNPTSNNRSGFTGLPSGIRYSNGSFFASGSNGTWWSSTDCGDTNYAYIRSLDSGSSSVFYYGNDTRYGFSVRCLRDK